MYSKKIVLELHTAPDTVFTDNLSKEAQAELVLFLDELFDSLNGGLTTELGKELRSDHHNVTVTSSVGDRSIYKQLKNIGAKADKFIIWTKHGLMKATPRQKFR